MVGALVPLRTPSSVSCRVPFLLSTRAWQTSLYEHEKHDIKVAYQGRLDTIYRFYSGKKRGPDFRRCESVDDVLDLALEHINHLRRYEIAVVWTFLSRTLLKYRPNEKRHSKQVSHKEKTTQYELQILDILETTMNSIDWPWQK